MAESVLARMPLAGKIGVTALFVMLVGVAYTVVLYSDVAGQIDQAVSRRTVLKADLQTAKAAERAYQQDLEELARRKERERELNKILPQSTEYPAFLSAIQTVANSSGIDLTAWTPQPEVKEEYYARVPMKVELTGRFHQVAKFFYGIGQNDRIMNVENISIKNPESRDREVYVTVTGLATAFRALEDGEAEAEAGQGRRNSPGGGR